MTLLTSRIFISQIFLLVGLIGAVGQDFAFADFGQGGPGGYDSRQDRFAGGCLGGSCRRRDLVIMLPQRRVVQSVEFYAHDRIGNQFNGAVNLYVENILVAANIDIKKDGYTHFFSVNNIYASSVRFEDAVGDEVQIEWVNVTYADWGHGGDGDGGGEMRLEQQFFAGGCIGGSCPQREIFMDLGLHRGPALIESLDFYAHDNIGSHYDATVDILVDNMVVARGVDILRAGSQYHIQIHQYGRVVRIISSSGDEAQIGTVTVSYFRQGRRGGW